MSYCVQLVSLDPDQPYPKIVETRSDLELTTELQKTDMLIRTRDIKERAIQKDAGAN